jgi:outer membrane immunogenic protein
MKRFVFAWAGAVALAGLIGPADAADLSRPVYTNPPPMPPAYYQWTGFYLGINGGGAWGSSSWDSTGSFDTSGGLVGGTIGYNWQTGPWVLGLEGDIDWADIKGTTNVPGCIGGGCSSENDWLGTARGRVGYAFNGWMPYVTGGAAFGDVEATHAGATGQSTTQLGWTIGAGFEFAVVNNLTAKVEYLHYDLGSFQCGLNCGNGFVNDNVDFNANVVRGGLNLRF